MRLILNFLTEISVIHVQGNPQMLPQIRIDDVEAESCLNVTAIICPNNLRLIIICRLGTCVRSIEIAVEGIEICCQFCSRVLGLVEIKVGEYVGPHCRWRTAIVTGPFRESYAKLCVHECAVLTGRNCFASAAVWA
jgi:hypothetical protein